MLILYRNPDEIIDIVAKQPVAPGEHIAIVNVRTNHSNKSKIGIEASQSFDVQRREIVKHLGGSLNGYLQTMRDYSQICENGGGI